MKEEIRFEPLRPEEVPLFIRELQMSFSIAVQEKFGTTEIVPSEADVRKTIAHARCESYFVRFDDRRVGGVVVKIDPETQDNWLELFYVSPDKHSRGLGTAIWRAIEARYPKTRTWKTNTPSFEERNVHFYVNKCGFHITEFFHSKHVDPNASCPTDKNGNANPALDAYFLFEKTMIKS